MAELGTNYSGATMWASHFAPDDAVLAAFLLCFCLVHIGQPLAEIEIRFLLRFNSRNFDQSSVVILVRLSSLVSQELTSHIQSATPVRKKFKSSVLEASRGNESFLRNTIHGGAYKQPHLTRSPPMATASIKLAGHQNLNCKVKNTR